MKMSKKVSIFGNSFGIIIDKPIRDKLKLKKGDWIEIDIKPIKE